MCRASKEVVCVALWMFSVVQLLIVGGVDTVAWHWAFNIDQYWLQRVADTVRIDTLVAVMVGCFFPRTACDAGQGTPRQGLGWGMGWRTGIEAIQY